MSLLAFFDAFSLLFFVLHIPISVIVDSQVLFPASWYPKWAIATMEDYIAQSGDPLMSDLKPWFVSLVTCEIAFQVPFFIFGVYCYLKRSGLIRLPAIVYSVHTCTAMVPILTTIITTSLSMNPDDNKDNNNDDQTDGNFDLGQMLMTYIPFSLFPLFLGIRWIIVNEAPFGGTEEGKTNHSKAKKI